jgi:hypothetical protein
MAAAGQAATPTERISRLVTERTSESCRQRSDGQIIKPTRAAPASWSAACSATPTVLAAASTTTSPTGTCLMSSPVP